MAELSRKGREYFHWPITNAPTGVTAWDAWIGGAWQPLTLNGQVLQLLVQGPDVDVPDPTAVTLTTSATDIQIRATDNPEVPVRDGGQIWLIN